MSEIKGIDQIFPKRENTGAGASNLKVWAVAGVVAVLAAGYALVPTGSATSTAPVSKPGTREPVVAAPVSAEKPVVETSGKKSTPVPATPIVEDVRTARQQVAKKQQQQAKSEISHNSGAAEVKAPAKASSRSCDCETAELNLPAECPDASCRQCKATCGIPGNN